MFTYDKVGYADLPDKIIIPLVKNDEKFQLTWYGNLNFKYEKIPFVPLFFRGGI